MKSLFNNIKKAVSGLSNIVEKAGSGNSDLQVDDLKQTVSGLAGKLGNTISSVVAGEKIRPESSMVASVLEKTGIKSVPFSFNKLYLKIPADDSIPESWYILVDLSEQRILFTTTIEADLTDKFMAAGLDAVYKYPLTKVTKEMGMQEISSTKALKHIITELVQQQKNVIQEYVGTDDYTSGDLDVMVFDCEHVAKGMEHSKYFNQIDEDGDVKLVVNPTSDCMYKRIIWVMPTPDRIVLDCLISDVEYPETLETTAQEMEAEFNGLKFKVNDDGKLRIKAYIDPEDYPAADIPEEIFKLIDSTIEKLLAVSVVALKKMNIRVSANHFFNLTAIREQLKKLPYFQKIDDDGDIQLRVDGNADFQPSRFAWIILKNDRVTISGGILGYSTAGATVAPEDVVKKFNNTNSELEAFVSDDTVRVCKRLELKDYPATNPTEKLVEDVKRWNGKVIDALTSVASIAGMKVDYYKPDLKWLEGRLNKDNLGEVTLKDQELNVQLKPTKTTDGDLLTKSTIVVKTSDTTSKFELKVEFEKKCDNETALKTANQFLPSLAKSIHQGVDCEAGNYSINVRFTLPHHTLESAKQFSNIYLEAIQTLINIDSKASDLVLEAYNQEIRDKRERERRRLEEERERERERQAEIAANRERELNTGFNYTLRSGGTIRNLQEGFTEDYPYLRIGVYKVKTGESADRNGGTISHYDQDITFGKIKSFKGDCIVRIEGRSTPESLEKQFRSVSGLVIKICYNDRNDNRFYIPKDSSDYKTPICDLNRKFREAGYEKADIS